MSFQELIGMLRGLVEGLEQLPLANNPIVEMIAKEVEACVDTIYQAAKVIVHGIKIIANAVVSLLSSILPLFASR